ncbi:MAG: diadenosine tetraphosphate hydrolase [archaeon]|jgi:diadenosine tetraphosphate (Ap4A) HIT family hydrolase
MDPKNYPFYKWDVFETKHFILGQDWENPIPAFFIVEPKRKTMKSILDMTKEEYADYSKMVLKTRILMKEGLGIKTVFFYQEEIATHFHTWVLPRYEWMEKFGRSIESVRTIMKYSEEKMMTPKDIASVKEVLEKAKKYAVKKKWLK